MNIVELFFLWKILVTATSYIAFLLTNLADSRRGGGGVISSGPVVIRGARNVDYPENFAVSVVYNYTSISSSLFTVSVFFASLFDKRSNFSPLCILMKFINFNKLGWTHSKEQSLPGYQSVFVLVVVVIF